MTRVARRCLVLVVWLSGCGGGTDGGTGATSGAADAGAGDGAVALLGGPPKVAVVAPVAGLLVAPGAVVTFRATVSDPEDRAVDLRIEWVSDRDGVLGLSTPTAAGEAELGTTTLTAGAHVVTARVTDPAGHVATASTTLTVDRAPVGTPKVTIAPSAPKTDDTLVASTDATVSDPDGQPVLYRTVWFVDGVLANVAGVSVPSAATQRGQTWRALVTPHDGLVDGTPGEAQVVIGNTAPKAAAAKVLPSAGGAATSFTCAPEGFSDPDGDAPSATVRWEVNGTEVAQGALISGLYQKGDVLTCRLTPTDGAESGPEVGSEPMTILDTPPGVKSATITPIEGDKTALFTCGAEGVSDPDPNDTVTLDWVWVVNGQDQPGTTSQSLSAEALKKGDTLRCKVIPSSGGVGGSPALSPIVTIGNAPPALLSVLVKPSPATKLTPAQCVPGQPTDPDGDPVSYIFTWYVNGTVIAGVTTDTLAPSHFGKGDLVWCAAAPSDGSATGAAVTSKSKLTIQSSPPTITGVVLGPVPANESTELGCTPEGWSDIDGDSASYTYQWVRNGQLVPGAVGATLDGAAFDRGDLVLCTATPTDGDAVGDPLASNAVQIGNMPPSITSAVVTPPFGSKNGAFTCVPKGHVDADAGDPELYSFTWTLNGAPVTGATSATLVPGPTTQSGAQVACTATPFDGTDSGAPKSSPPAVVTNVPPVVDAVAINPANASAASTLTCQPSGLTDLDGDPVSLTTTWIVNGAPFTGATQSTLAPGTLKTGDQVACQVTPSDGQVNGTPKTSSTVTLANAPPSGLVVAVVPASPTSSAPFECVVKTAATDPEGESVTVSYAWLRDDAATGLTGAIVPKGNAKACETWTCVATPTDGKTAGAPATADTVIDEGRALVLDGTGSVDTPDAGGNALAGGKFTIEAWVRLNAHADGVIASKRGLGSLVTDRGFTLKLQSDGTASLLIDIDTSPPKGATSTAKLPLFQWVHVAGTYDGTVARVFVGGHLEASFAIIGPIDAATGLHIGSDGTGGGGFVGSLDEVRLSSTVVYTADFVPTPRPGATTGTVGLYHFELGDAVATPDDSGLALHAGVTGGVTYGPGMCGGSQSAPNAPVVTIAPLAPKPAEALTCTATATDPDGDTVTYTYQWLKNGSALSGLTAKTLPIGSTGACETWTCEAVAKDQNSSGPKGTASVSTGPGGGMTWYEHNSYDPVTHPQTKSVNQFFQVERVATPIVIPASGVPLKMTHVRLFAPVGSNYYVTLYADGFGEPGTELAIWNVSVTSSYPTIKLVTPYTITSAGTYWLGLQGFGDFMTVVGDADGETLGLPNAVYSCLSFGSGCITEPAWSNMGSLGTKFKVGDLILELGSEQPTGSCQ